MKKTLFVLTMLLPMQAISIEQDSVYKWGNWESGIQPAAAPIARVTPPPVKKPDVNFRPNENSAFSREAIQIQNLTQNGTITGIAGRIAALPVQVAPPTAVIAPPPPPPLP